MFKTLSPLMCGRVFETAPACLAIASSAGWSLPSRTFGRLAMAGFFI